MEETGITIGPLRFLRLLNCTSYAPKHYVDIAFAAEWKAGEPEVREPDKVERWEWHDPDKLPSPLFAMLPSAIAALLDARDMSLLWEDLADPPLQRGGNGR
jgi:8-oxo-dGTP pyrophosphatase MutT (NUDIX family)